MTEKRIVLFEYFTTESAILLFIVRADLQEPQVVEIAMPMEEVRQFVTNHFGTNSDRGQFRSLNEKDWQEKLGALVKPIAEWTDEGDIVWLVPYDLLHYLPLHALKVEGQYLIERNPVCYTPSASVMKYCRTNRKNRRRRALIMADSRPDSHLMYAHEQARVIQNAFQDNAEIYLGAAATKTLLRQKLTKASEDIDIIHFACHGYFHPQQALKSGIMLAPENLEALRPNQEDSRVDESQWNLTAEEIFSLQMPVDLVTLSACESGVNERRSGDELIGLTRSLIYAGTPSVVVSLWAVDDLSTSILMGKFYEELLKPDTTKVKALQRAQLYLKGVTIQEAIAYIDKMRSREDYDLQSAINLDMTRAEMLLVAHDFAAAHSAFQTILNYPNLDAQSNQQARSGVEKAKFLSGSNIAADYNRHPYDDIYYWAPFILVGDWK
jgi:CHAT domain-containing protein